MKTMIVVAALAALAALSPVYGAADVRLENVTLGPGKPVALKGTIKGDQTVRYALTTTGAGPWSVRLDASSSSNYVNVARKGAAEALHVGSMSGNVFEAGAATPGEYTVTVYLTRNAARRATVSRYTLHLDQPR